jgi:putative peptidoglycan lipid II flippase
MVRETFQRARTRLVTLRTNAYSRIAAPIQGLHQAAYLLAGLTLASQLLALLRDRTFAHTFGAGQTLDLYYAAFRVPDLVFAVVSSLVSAYVIIPRIADLDREATKKLLSETASFLLVVGGGVCVVLAIYMRTFLLWLYPDLMATTAADSFVLLGRMLLIQPVLLGLSSIYSSVTQVHRRFFLFALSPVLYNLGIIFGTMYLYPIFGLPGIGGGVVIGAFAYLAVNFPVLTQAGVFPRLVWPNLRDMALIMKDSVPRSLALGMNSIIALGLISMASRMGTGSVSVFTFAWNLEAVPLALIGSSYAVAAFPALSKASALKHKDEFTRILSSSARHILLWSMIAVGLIVVLRAHLVRAILGTGAFDWSDTRLTAALLALLSVALAADALKLLLSRALYAARQSWQPLMYQIAAGAVTFAVAYWLLMLPAERFLLPLAALLKVGDVPQTGILLLALASALGQIFLVVLSLLALRSIAPGLATSLLVPLRDGTIAAIVGGVAAHAVLAVAGDIAALTTLAAVFIEGLIAGIVGIIAAGITLSILRNPEFALILEVVRRVVRRKEPATDVLEPAAEEPMHQ